MLSGKLRLLVFLRQQLTTNDNRNEALRKVYTTPAEKRGQKERKEERGYKTYECF